MFYPFLRTILFAFPPEDVHHISMNLLRTGCRIGPLKNLLSASFGKEDPRLQKNVFGLNFRNPVGLGAGFDKNALYLNELETLGFGFVEIGTVTPKPQPGNETPRLFRLPKDKALINRMGFNNDGVDVVRARLEKYPRKMIIGGNIGKNKLTPNEIAWKDYLQCFDTLFETVDYFVVNVSSPNTPGLRELQEKAALEKILTTLQHANKGKNKPKPILLKISPDLELQQLDAIIELALEIKLDGFVATNTTIARNQLRTAPAALERMGAGGLSGKPLQNRSTEVVQYLFKQTGGAIPLIASGGIFTGADAKEKIEAGASLIQVWTGFIYEGPSIVKHICRALL